MNEPRIQDIPSIKNVLQQARAFKLLKAFSPLLKPVLRLLGVDVTKIDETDFDKLIRQAEELSTIPDRFNDLFAERGWIMFDLMNLEAAKAAVEKGESGDIEGAEEYLANHFDTETVTWLLRMMNHVKTFQPRMRLAEKALVDYAEERYHACIPVVLALLDGLVNELHEKRRGFFSQEANLEAWDSVAAHSKGLNTLKRIFNTSRQKTRTEPISIPYRNGIVHGMDLGYDNRMVAAKTWAALFATRDWALKAEQGLITAPAETPKISWSELFKQIAEHGRNMADSKARLEAWTPRTCVVGQNIPINGEPEAYGEGSPERKLAEFLAYWRSSNYGKMVQCIAAKHVPFLGGTSKQAPAAIREQFSSRKLKNFELLDVSDTAAALTVIKVKLLYEEYGRDVEQIMEFRIVNEDERGDVAVRGTPNTGWRLVTYYV